MSLNNNIVEILRQHPEGEDFRRIAKLWEM